MKKFLLRTKRHFVQLLAALLYNLDFQGIATLSVGKSVTKGVCVPGLHCYSCPGAIGACPIGALQQSLGASSLKLPFYVVGCLLRRAIRSHHLRLGVPIWLYPGHA